MTTVQNTATDPGGEPLININVRIALMTGSTTTPGYTTSGDISATYIAHTDSTGTWSATLTPNASITPANTYYQVVEGQAISNIVVPATGGPYSLSEILVTTPPTPSAVGITGVQVAAAGTIAGVRPEINLVGSGTVSVAAVDNPGASRVDVTISATGGSPATTVQAGTAYGTSSAVGTDTTYAREDHQHGTPSLAAIAPATTEGIGQSAAVGTATTPARADHVHPLAAAGTPSASAVGDTAATGTASTFAASDHVHGREAFGAPTAQTSYGQASNTGTAATVAHSDHTHGTPALASSAPATTQAIGTSAAVGTGTTPARSDHVHPMASAGTPGSSAVGDAAATGVSTSFAAADHAHGRESFGAVVALSAFNTASANGSAATVAHSDHVHGAPALPTATTSTAGVAQFESSAGTLQAAGVAALGANGKTVDSGHTHPLQPWIFPITKHGAVGDLQCVTDGAMTNGGNTITSASAPFVPAHNGMTLVAKGALSNGNCGIGTLTYVSATQVTVTFTATAATPTGLQIVWGSSNTAAIQATIDEAQAYQSPFGIAAEVFTPGSSVGYGYLIDGPLKSTTSAGTLFNSQLTIAPTSDRAAKRRLAFTGVGDAGDCRHWNQDFPAFGGSTWFSACLPFTTLAQQQTGTNGVSTLGNPSVLGGPAGKAGYGVTGTNPLFSNTTVAMKDMTILTAHSVNGWTISPFNFHGMAGAHLDRCSFGTNGVVQYYTGAGGSGGNTDFASTNALSGGISIGGLMPAAGNNASNRISNCVWNGGYTYGPLWTEHTVGDGVNTILYCWSGFCPTGLYGDGGTGAGALHAIRAGQLCVEGCAYHVNVFGAAASSKGPYVHAVIDTEGSRQLRDNPTGGTGLAAMRGEIKFTGSSSVPALTFPTACRIILEENAPGVYTSGVPALVANTAVCNTLYRHATVYLTGGTAVTAVEVSSLMGGASAPATAPVFSQASGAVPANTPIRVGPGAWIKVDTTGTLPTAVWVLD